MRRGDVLGYLRRDRELVARSRDEHWARVRRHHGAVEAIRVAAALRRDVLQRVPGWPGDEERSEDRAVHERVSAMLDRVTTPRTD